MKRTDILNVWKTWHRYKYIMRETGQITAVEEWLNQQLSILVQRMYINSHCGLNFFWALGKCSTVELSYIKAMETMNRRAACLHTICCQLFHKRRLLYTWSHNFSLGFATFEECEKWVNSTKQGFADCDWCSRLCCPNKLRAVSR